MEKDQGKVDMERPGVTREKREQEQKGKQHLASFRFRLGE
jgi:hypothetical protein